MVLYLNYGLLSMLLMLILEYEYKIHHLYQMIQKFLHCLMIQFFLLNQKFQKFKHFQKILNFQKFQHFQTILKILNLHHGQKILNLHKLNQKFQKFQHFQTILNFQKIHFHYYHQTLNEHIQFAEMKSKP